MDTHETDKSGRNMKYARIPYVKRDISRIFYGTATPPFSTSGEGNELLDAMLELGVNAFDTARVYGNAENALGKWMEERGVRDRVTILSKCGHPDTDWTKRISEKEIRADFAQSSACLRTGYIDIYLAHRDDAAVPAGDVVEIFNAMHAEGKIGAFGGSNWTHERIEEANEYAYKHDMIPFTVSSPNFGRRRHRDIGAFPSGGKELVRKTEYAGDCLLQSGPGPFFRQSKERKAGGGIGSDGRICHEGLRLSGQF